MIPERRLRDPDERRLFACWARNVVALYGVLFALTFALLACVPDARSSAAKSSNGAMQAAATQAVFALPPYP